jgi:hypothetical protein
MTEKELKLRTRKFAVDVLNFIDKLPTRKVQTLFQINLVVAQAQSQQTIVQHAEQEAIMSLFLKLVLLKKKLMNQLFG